MAALGDGRIEGCLQLHAQVPAAALDVAVEGMHLVGGGGEVLQPLLGMIGCDSMVGQRVWNCQGRE